MKNMNSKVFLLQGKLTDQRVDVITVYQTFLQKNAELMEYIEDLT